MTARIAATRRLAFLFALLLLQLLGGLPARADTPVSLFQSFRGNVNFVGTEESLRTKDNSRPCSLVYGGSIYAYLGGIPKGATVESAQLYWAGSGTDADYKVTFDGAVVRAPVARQYIAKAKANNTSYTYFSGAADVTSQVKKKGNGYYTFSGLDVDNGYPWCGVQGVVGGFALVVVYSHPDEPFRMLNLYEGFQDFQNTSLKIDLGNFNVPSPLPDKVTGRIGHITWEGDWTLSQGGEDLLFNTTELTDGMNPKGNQFNSASNVTGDKTSYGIDFDIYTLTAPTIQPGQKTATTTYRSGQDMVILSAEIVAMPYVANADLAMAMTRTGNLTVGSSTSYTLTVTNGGIDDEMGPVTVVDTLPAGLKLVSARGTGWTCTNAASGGQTVVTCTQSGPVKAGAKMSALTIVVSPAKAGNYTNTATVSGKTGDNKLGNNTATNSGDATGNAPVDNGSVALVFTSRACTAGEVIAVGAEDTGCPRFNGWVTAADGSTKIYITAVSGVPQKAVVPASQAQTIEVKASCLPFNKAPISYGGVALDCSSTGASASLDLAFAAGAASVGPAVNYEDVGRVSLAMRRSSKVLDSVDFVSRPAAIRLREVARVVDDYPATQGETGFAEAGEPFTMRLGALMANDKWAPSFGQEGTALKGIVPDDWLDFSFTLDAFAVSQLDRLPLDADDVVHGAFKRDDHFVPGTKYANTYEARASYFEAGLLAITPQLDDYLNTGPVSDKIGRTGPGTRIVGRFYPDHFQTAVTQKSLVCAVSMHCPTGDGVAFNGAAYSMQNVEFTIKAYGLPTADGGQSLLSLYQNVNADGKTPGPLMLQASKAPNLVKTNTLADAQPPAIGYFAVNRGASINPTTRLAPPTPKQPFPDMKVQLAYQLGDLYSNGARGAGNWGAPTPVYLRAVLPETRGGVAAPIAISSMTPPGAPAETQYEDGLMVVSGRLFVQNVFGSDLLRLPVPLTAQYWSGTAWLASAGDNSTALAPAILPAANGCRLFFALDPKKPGPCKANPLTIAAAAPIVLNKGIGTLGLQAPTRGTVGSVDYTLDVGAAKDWLPSTQARATFGLYRSPLIYLREVY